MNNEAPLNKETSLTQDEVVRDFFKRSIAILDRNLNYIYEKYPWLKQDEQ